MIILFGREKKKKRNTYRNVTSPRLSTNHTKTYYPTVSRIQLLFSNVHINFQMAIEKWTRSDYRDINENISYRCFFYHSPPRRVPRRLRKYYGCCSIPVNTTTDELVASSRDTFLRCATSGRTLCSFENGLIITYIVTRTWTPSPSTILFEVIGGNRFI